MDAAPTIARQFLLMWSCVGTRIIRDMTLHSAPSFGGSFSFVTICFIITMFDCQVKNNIDLPFGHKFILIELLHFSIFAHFNCVQTASFSKNGNIRFVNYTS